ncbi:hypothetical protein ACFSKM_08270 [Ancylobacter dichloromethanicus]
MSNTMSFRSSLLRPLAVAALTLGLAAPGARRRGRAPPAPRGVELCRPVRHL